MSMDGARASARRNAWQKISIDCPCGRRVHGNGKAHQRSCDVHLRTHGWPLEDAMVAAILDEYRGQGAHVVGAVQKRLGQDYLARRAAGDKTEMRWIEYRDKVWQYADEAAIRTW